MTGDLDLLAGIVKAILQRGYRGPIGIVGHRKEVAAEASLREDLEGLDGPLEDSASAGDPTTRR